MGRGSPGLWANRTSYCDALLCVVHATEGNARRFVVVLHHGPIDSPEKAVRAAIVEGERNG